jgi:hypothetical protein
MTRIASLPALTTFATVGHKRKIFVPPFVCLHDLGQFAALFGAISKPLNI